MWKWMYTKKVFLSAVAQMRESSPNTAGKPVHTSAFCLRHNYRYDAARNHWTQAHLKWRKALKPEGLYQEILSGYLSAYDQLTDKRKRLDKRIEELAADTDYQENVRKLTCFLKIKIQTALAMVVEVGGFKRFPTAQKFASYLGLVPGRISAGVPITGLELQKQEQPCTYVTGKSSTKLYPWDNRQ